MYYDEEPGPSSSPTAYEIAVTTENGELEREGSESEGEGEPPPIPPRNNSLSSTETGSLTGAGKEGVENGSADHFLGGGRGDGVYLSPLSSKSGSTRENNTAAGTGEDNEGGPPPIPGRKQPTPESEMEEGEVDETVLLSELEELNRLLSKQDRREHAQAQTQDREM